MPCKKLLLALVTLAIMPAAHAQQTDAAPLDLALAALPSIDWGPDRDKLVAIDQAITAGINLEDRLLPILASETATDAAKSYVCRKLKEIGTSKSVPTLAAFLDNPDLSHMARYALESIPGNEATEVLVEAIPSLERENQIGVIHTLGRRGDVTATPALLLLLDDENEATTCAALIAVSGFYSEEATKAVVGFLKRSSERNREVASDACLRISQRLIENGKLDEATALIDALEAVGDPKLEVAIFRGRLLCEPKKSTEHLLAALQSGDDQLSRFAAEFARRSATQQQVEILATATPKLSLERQILLLNALGIRESSAVRRTALSSLDSDNKALLLAAVRALRVSGSVEDARALVSLASQGHDALFDEIVETLSVLSGPAVESVLIGMLPDSEPDGQIALIEALKKRGSQDAVRILLELTHEAIEPVQIAALRALEVLPNEAAIAPLIEMLAVTPAGSVRSAVERTLWITCLKTLDPEDRPVPLLEALAGADQSRRIALLPCLGRLGGDKALQLVHEAMGQDDSELNDAAVRALTNWPDDSVAEEMWEIAQSAEQKEHRIWALRGYARVIARRGRSDPEDTCERLKKALEIAERVEDKQLILTRLTAARTPASLELALSRIDDPQLKPSALDAAAALGEAMKDTHPVEARKALERVAALTSDPDMQLYISKLLWNMALKGN